MAKAKQRGSGHYGTPHSATRRYMPDGVPLEDGPADIVLYVTDADIACAIAKDPCACAIAQAFKRAVGDDAAEAQILRSRAYVKAFDEDGNAVWHRYIVDGATRELVERFDRTQIAHRGGYRLRAPKGAQRLDAQLAKQRKRDAEGGPRKSGKRRRTDRGVTLASTVRNGAGQVHTRIEVEVEA